MWEGHGQAPQKPDVPAVTDNCEFLRETNELVVLGNMVGASHLVFATRGGLLHIAQ